MALFNPLSNSFGLDIGDRTLKVVQMAKRGRSLKPYRLTAWGQIDIPEGIMDRGEVLDMSSAVRCVTELLGRTTGSLKGRGVVACLPEAKSFVKIVRVPKDLNEIEIKKTLAKEIEQNIPLKIDEIYYDWQKIDAAKPAPPVPAEPPAAAEAGSQPAEAPAEAGEPAASEPAEAPAEETEAEEENTAALEAEADDNSQRLLLAAAPKNLIDDYTQILEMAGLAPIAFEIEAVAIARSIVPVDESLTEAVGILDIGATRSSLVIYDGGALQMSISIPISGIELTKIIADQLHISQNDAELVKIECGLDAHRCEDRMWNILLPIIDDMCAKIRNAVRFYKIGFPLGKKIERLYLCGGGAHFREIDSVLSRKLTIKVRRGDALINVQRPKQFPEDRSLTFATAIGLAMRAADESDKYRGTFSF